MMNIVDRMMAERFQTERPWWRTDFAAILLRDCDSFTLARMFGVGQFRRGDFVKFEAANEATGEREWMWLRVDDSDDARRLVFGKLDSEPIAVTNMRLGMELAISYDNVRDHRTAVSFRQ